MARGHGAGPVGRRRSGGGTEEGREGGGETRDDHAGHGAAAGGTSERTHPSVLSLSRFRQRLQIVTKPQPSESRRFAIIISGNCRAIVPEVRRTCFNQRL